MEIDLRRYLAELEILKYQTANLLKNLGVLVPYTGALKNVDLGLFSLTAERGIFNTTDDGLSYLQSTGETVTCPDPTGTIPDATFTYDPKIVYAYTLTNGGSGYAADETVNIDMGNGDAQIYIISVDGSGAIVDSILNSGGSGGYTTGAANLTGGSGAGATITVDLVGGNNSYYYPCFSISHQIRVYCYKNVGAYTVYSANYIESNTVADNGDTDPAMSNYLTWTLPALPAGADGFIVFDNNGYNAHDFGPDPLFVGYALTGSGDFQDSGLSAWVTGFQLPPSPTTLMKPAATFTGFTNLVGTLQVSSTTLMQGLQTIAMNSNAGPNIRIYNPDTDTLSQGTYDYMSLDLQGASGLFLKVYDDTAAAYLPLTIQALSLDLNATLTATGLDINGDADVSGTMGIGTANITNANVTNLVVTNAVPFWNVGIPGNKLNEKLELRQYTTTTPPALIGTNAGVTVLSETLGAEKVTNGTFTGSLSGQWSLASGWQQITSSYVAHTTNGTGAVSQTAAQMVTPFVFGELYKAQITIQGGFQSGTITLAAGGVTLPAISCGNTAGQGTYTFYFVATDATAGITITPSNTLRDSCDNVTIKKVTGGDLYVINSIISTGAVKGKGFNYSSVTKTGTYTATANDDLIICNSASAFTINLPVASASGKRFTIKNINTGEITVDGDSGDTIDGETTQILNQWDCMEIMDYVANKWVIV